ncbi:MAG: metallophosphoesterase [Planctomycetota bacterium]
MKQLNMKRLILAVCCLFPAACEVDDGLRLPARQSPPAHLAGYELLCRIAHITDTHIVDEESPARFAGAQDITSSAWRPYEAHSTQLLDGIIREINRIHASGRTIDFVVHTGDTCDNSQSNELAWLLDLFDGGEINPLTGPDDRPPETRPDPLMDPHAAFQAQGLYQSAVHGDAASVPWYVVFGNHDRFAIGVFPIFQDFLGRRTAPLPFSERPGILLPNFFDPLAGFTHGTVTPANPGPPPLLDPPAFVLPNPGRGYFNKGEFISAMFTTTTGPPGHGFVDPQTDHAWYSVSPTPGLRLIGLDTCEPAHKIEGFPYQDGSILGPQVDFFRAELDAATQQGEVVIVTSHHPSASLWEGYGSVLIGSTFRELLNEYPNVILHLAGHSHHNLVSNRLGYVEIETCSTLDLPQEGRIVEIWRNPADGTVAIAYDMFSHLDDDLPALGDDPLRSLRRAAQQTAQADATAAQRQKRWDPSGADPHGRPADRTGLWLRPAPLRP